MTQTLVMGTNKIRIIKCIVLLVSTISFANAAETDTLTLNLSQTEELFIRNNFDLLLQQSQTDKAKAELTLAKTHLDFTEIRAPFDGITGRFNDVRLGSLVDEGELLTTLSDNSQIWVYFNVPESEYLDYITSKKPDNDLRVKLQMANYKLFEHEGVVETIESEFNNETGNIAFRATFKNSNRILRHGETGNILMPVELKGALLIPQKATFEILDKKFVYVLDKENVIHSREIKIGVEIPHLYQVIGGLNEGDKILVEGLRKVKNAQEIKSDFEPLHKILSELRELHAE